VANQRDKTIGEDKGEFCLNVKGGEEVKSQLYLLIVRFILLSAIKVIAAGSLFTFHINCLWNYQLCSYFLLAQYVNVSENIYCMIGTMWLVLALFAMTSEYFKLFLFTVVNL